MKRFRIVRVRPCHWPRSILTPHSSLVTSRRQIKQIEISLVMPNAELSVVGERIAEITSVVGRTREGHRLMQCLSIDDGVYTIAEIARRRIEIDTAKIIVNRVELMIILRESTCCTEIERAAVS